MREGDAPRPTLALVGTESWVERTVARLATPLAPLCDLLPVPVRRVVPSDAVLALAEDGAVGGDPQRAIQRRLTEGVFDLVFITSRHALLGARCPSGVTPPVACVGEATAAAVRALGYEVPWVGAGGSAELAEVLLASEPVPRRVLWLRGTEVVSDGVQALRERGVRIEELITYTTVVVAPSLDLRERLRRAEVVLVGSPSGLARIATGSVGDTLRTRPLLVLGASSARAAHEHGWRDVRVTPTDTDALVETVRAALRGDTPTS